MFNRKNHVFTGKFSAGERVQINSISSHWHNLPATIVSVDPGRIRRKTPAYEYKVRIDGVGTFFLPESELKK